MKVCDNCYRLIPTTDARCVCQIQRDLFVKKLRWRAKRMVNSVVVICEAGGFHNMRMIGASDTPSLVIQAMTKEALYALDLDACLSQYSIAPGYRA